MLLQLATILGDHGLLGVTLTTDRHVLTKHHGMAPPTRPVAPAVRIVAEAVGAPATPTTRPATDTIPSLAPKTPARSRLSRCADPIV